MVNAWVDGNYMNYGFVLVDSVENDPDHWTTLYSSDADSPHKPELDDFIYNRTYAFCSSCQDKLDILLGNY